MTRGGRICLFSSLRSSRLAACLLRRRCTRTSSTTPAWSTARQSQCFTPVILSTTSSRCHLSPTRGRRRRIWLANGWPNLRAHCRTVSWLTMMPRAASNSSTMRSPSGKRKYNHTAWPMISAGNRYPAYRARGDVLILPDYSPRSVRASAARARQVDGACSRKRGKTRQVDGALLTIEQPYSGKTELMGEDQLYAPSLRKPYPVTEINPLESLAERVARRFQPKY